MNINKNRTTNNEVIYSDDLTRYNKIVGIVLPTNDPETMFDRFLVGLPNLKEINEISTILINFQEPWTKDLIREAVSIIHDNGFKVRYTINKYVFENPYVPFNLMREDASQLLPEAMIYLSMDDDFKVLGVSPKIGKTGGQQYLECIHYMLSHPKCGVISTTGTIGRNPAREYLGPDYKRHIRTYIMTGLGLFCRNLKLNDDSGCFLPSGTHNLYGALEDMIAGSYRIANGYYVAKYNCVRVSNIVNTKAVSSTDEETFHKTGWEKASVIESNNVKYVKDNWNKDYNRKSLWQDSVSYELYESKGGLPVWDEEVARQLTVHYPKNSTRPLLQEIKDMFDKEECS